MVPSDVSNFTNVPVVCGSVKSCERSMVEEVLPVVSVTGAICWAIETERSFRDSSGSMAAASLPADFPSDTDAEFVGNEQMGEYEYLKIARVGSSVRAISLGTRSYKP